MHNFKNKAFNNNILWLGVIALTCTIACTTLAMDPKAMGGPKVRPKPITFDMPVDSDAQQEAVAPAAAPIREFTTTGINGSPVTFKVVDRFASPPEAKKKSPISMRLSYTRAAARWFDPTEAQQLYAEHKTKGINMPSPATAIRGHRVPFEAEKELKLRKRLATGYGEYREQKTVRFEYDASVLTDVTHMKQQLATGKLEYCIAEETIFHRLFRQTPGTCRYLCRECEIPFINEADCDAHIRDKHMTSELPAAKRRREISQEKDHEKAIAEAQFKATRAQRLAHARELGVLNKTLEKLNQEITTGTDPERTVLLTALFDRKKTKRDALFSQAMK